MSFLLCKGFGGAFCDNVTLRLSPRVCCLALLPLSSPVLGIMGALVPWERQEDTSSDQGLSSGLLLVGWIGRD